MLTFWVRVSNKYNKLQQNEERRKTSISLGVQSIIQSVICGVFVVLCLWGLRFCVDHIQSIWAGTVEGVFKGLPILTIFGIVVFALAAFLFFVQGVIGGLLYMIYQFRLNARAVRWVALVVWILVIIAIFVFAAIFFFV